MMHTIWMRLFITSLMLLGDYAYSSEFDSHFNADIIAGDNAGQSYQSALLDDDGTPWVPSQASGSEIRARIRFLPQIFKPAIARLPDSTRKYSSLNPRAPPLRAS
jgi:hypothetical protein